MEKLKLAALFLIGMCAFAMAQTTIQRVEPGLRLIDGNTVNQLIDRLSGSGATGAAALCTVTGASPQTCNGYRGTVTSGTLTTAAVTAATYTVNNSFVSATSVLSCDIATYSGTLFTNGLAELFGCTPGAGTITISFANTHATNALNGTLKFNFVVFN